MGIEHSVGDPKKIACKANAIKGYSLGVDNVPLGIGIGEAGFTSWAEATDSFC